MTQTTIRMIGAVLLALALLSAHPATSEPMKCSGEEKACTTACKKAARVAVSVCLTACGARLSACVKTGCWDNGAQRYCGLSKL
jgi:hypothetical protein